MTTETVSNIDDLLIGGQGNSQQPATPESNENNEDIYGDSEQSQDEITKDLSENATSDEQEESSESAESAESAKDAQSFDDYGNPTENMTEGMKKRLKKQADKYETRISQLETQIAQLTPRQHQELQQAAQNFQENPNSEDDWQKQFSQMVEQTVYNMSVRQQQESQRMEAIRLDKDFERKLFAGMEKFSDFTETIRDLGCEITNHMTHATRSLEDPAAFLYAASKRHPEELHRISKLQDPYAQVREMGKLEERMRKNKTTSNAPRALGKSKEDSSFPALKNKKDGDTIEDLIAKSDAKRLAQARAKYGRR